MKSQFESALATYGAGRPAAGQAAERYAKYGRAIILVALSLIIVATYRDYGVTWDEAFQMRDGELTIEYFRSGLRYVEDDPELDRHSHGALVEGPIALLARRNGQWNFALRHLLIAIIGMVGIISAMRLSRRFSDPWVSVLAPLSLALTPHYYGHIFNNSKDVPFAAFFSLGVAAIAALFHRGTFRWREVLATGAAIGLALGVRPLGFILFLLLAVAAVTRWRAIGRVTINDGSRLLLLIKIAALIGSAWVVMCAGWPWAQKNVLLTPWRVIRMFGGEMRVYPVFFDGRMWLSNQLPWYYLPKLLAITTPPAILAFAVMGFFFAFFEFWQKPNSSERVLLALVIAWTFLPVLAVALARPNMYDGLRHMLFILPGIAVLSGIGAARLAAVMPTGLRMPMIGLFVALILTPLPEMRALHPYQSSYHNVFVGGVGAAWRRFETDYWLSSYKEAMEWVATQHSGPRKVFVLVACNRYSRLCADAYRPSFVEIHEIFGNVENESLPPPFDYYISTTRYGLANNFPKSPVVHTVGRAGAIFTVIRKGPGIAGP